MALKQDSRYNKPDDITLRMKTAGDRGGVVVYMNDNPFTSDPDDPEAVVGYAPTASGVPAGLLMMDVKDYDPTQVERNFQNPYEVPVGSKVWLLTGGYVETDMVDPAVLASIDPSDPAAGKAYLGASGMLTNVDTGIPVGRFRSYADSDGFVKYEINLNQ